MAVSQTNGALSELAFGELSGESSSPVVTSTGRSQQSNMLLLLSKHRKRHPRRANMPATRIPRR